MKQKALDYIIQRFFVFKNDLVKRMQVFFYAYPYPLSH